MQDFWKVLPICCPAESARASGLEGGPPPTPACRAMQTLLTLLALGASGMELTPDTWDEATAGKTVFIKFLAPW